MEKNEEEFAKFLQTFVQDVWTQLMAVSQRPGQVPRGGAGRGGAGNKWRAGPVAGAQASDEGREH